MIRIRNIVPNLRWERGSKHIYATLLYLDVPNGVLASSRSVLSLEPVIALLTNGDARFMHWMPQDHGLMAVYHAPNLGVWCRVRLNGVNQGMGNYLLFYSVASRPIGEISDRAQETHTGPEATPVEEDTAADILAAAMSSGK